MAFTLSNFLNNPGGSSGGSSMGWFGPAMIGLSALSGLLQGRSQNQNADEDRDLRQRELIASILQSLSGDENDLLQRQGENALSSTQLDPYTQNRSLSNLQVMRQIMGSIRPMNTQVPGDILGSIPQTSGGLQLPTNGFDVSALTDDALASGAQAFYQNAANASGGQISVPNLGSMGLGSAGTNASQTAQGYADQLEKEQQLRRAQQRSAILAALSGRTEPANSWTTPGAAGGSATARNPWLGGSGWGTRRPSR